ncbi:uncharacterized protein KGF55_005219 [Candida pseudojiufengensis]|uniref:uncharacterized protein n=1 Tax=Candida pseudojiufengensis TaxID=497109 RepID=UPI0022258A95|nr:uncharacterized protein KGF55_005219 [Candida pseudojiufengensis]KAI5959575.1 hypothetical protein KGF55_005219 [Candida pseudojiufengensis]
MKVYLLLILNKSGGLIYQKEFQSGLSKLTANDYLVLAGTLHGVHAIGAKLTSNIIDKNFKGNNTLEELNSQHNAQILSTGKQQNSNCNIYGLKNIETEFFNLYIYQTVSGLKFIIITKPNLNPMELNILNDEFKNLYVAYSDYVMKNPFYSLDMPIKSQLFDNKVKEILI